MLATAVRSRGGDLALEWPRDCDYWKLDHVQEALMDFSMSKATFDGCALGLVAKSTGLPIRKPCSVATTAPILFHALGSYKCSGHAEHTPCAGSETRATEAYTPQMIKIIHDSIAAEDPRRHGRGEPRR